MANQAGSNPAHGRSLGGRRRRYALAAAGAVLALGAAALVGLLPRDTGPVLASAGIVQGDVRIRSARDSNWRPLSGATARIGAGTGLRSTLSGRLALDLPGPISLRLDAGGELALVGPREVELVAGVLYVDSSAAPAAEPFTIVTSLGTVQAIGAQAEVAVARSGLHVRVRSGDVELVQEAAAIPAAASTGEELQVLAGDSPRRLPIRTFGSDWTWIETLSSAPDFHGRTLASFLGWVTHETGRPLRFDTPTTEARAATQTLDVDVEGLEPMRALEIVLATTGLEHNVRYDGAIVVESRGTPR